MIPQAEADRMISRIHARKRRRLALLCLGIGVGVAEVGLVTWALRAHGIHGIAIVVLGVVPAGLLGVVLGALAMLVVPGSLARKPPSSAVRVFWLACLWTAIPTLITGWFPFCTAGVALCAASVYIAIRMPDERLAWSAQKCIWCSYDVSASPSRACSECGLSETALINTPLSGAIGNAAVSVALWGTFMMVLWGIATAMSVILSAV